ncbi:MAG: glycosyltransferase family 4 protein [Acidimicrobiales bacterium]|nr:glycosyltransferase family 4 protein [Acidimicrobiales bacterium]
MRVVVATVVHHPEDARIFHRQIPALVAAGHDVVYVAPTLGPDLTRPGVRHRPVMRAEGRHRIRALRFAAGVLAEESEVADLTIIHDPELTILTRSVKGARIWDVHEDLPSQIGDKNWIPGWLAGTARFVARRIEDRASSRFDLMLAEDSYIDRFPGGVVVRNTPSVPETVAPPDDCRVVYVGRVSRRRGAETMIDAMRRVDFDLHLDVYGPIDADIAPMLRTAGSNVKTHGFLANPTVLNQIQGAMAGLALLGETGNYEASMPTKVLEYMARGIPVVTTPNPVARQLVEESGAGLVVPFDDPVEVVRALTRLLDPEFRIYCAENGRQAVRNGFDWSEDAKTMLEFVNRVGTDGA